MIIGISGKIGSGKDLLGKIIQGLTDKPNTYKGMDVITEEDVNYKVWDVPTFNSKKFADTLKDFICMLLGCTRERLEDRDFKEGVLPEIWWYWQAKGKGQSFAYTGQNMDTEYWDLIKTTPRLLLQLMGTECGRDILHPNIWVNALFSDYKEIIDNSISNFHKPRMGTRSFFPKYPNWIITDMRFPNELDAVKERGITIRINRPRVTLGGGDDLYEHPSETSLDNATFDYTIENNGSIKDLVDKVREILIKEKLI